MRNLFILLGLSLFLGSCASKPPKDHGPGYCDIACNTPAIKVNLNDLPAGELTKAMLKRYVGDGTYTTILDTSYGHPFNISPDFDYQVRLTSGHIITIGGIKLVPTTTYDYCGTYCSDALTDFRMLYEYQVVPIRWELSADKKEYTVYMK